jgi:hypothetical protein
MAMDQFKWGNLINKNELWSRVKQRQKEIWPNHKRAPQK